MLKRQVYNGPQVLKSEGPINRCEIDVSNVLRKCDIFHMIWRLLKIYTKHSDSRPLVAISDKKDVHNILKHAKYLIWFPKVILENIIKHFKISMLLIIPLPGFIQAMFDNRFWSKDLVFIDFYVQWFSKKQI